MGQTWCSGVHCNRSPASVVVAVAVAAFTFAAVVVVTVVTVVAIVAIAVVFTTRRTFERFLQLACALFGQLGAGAERTLVVIVVVLRGKASSFT